jgi:hypothetical protein
MAILGMIKPYIQNEIPFIFSKVNNIQDEHRMTKAFK